MSLVLSLGRDRLSLDCYLTSKFTQPSWPSCMRMEDECTFSYCLAATKGRRIPNPNVLGILLASALELKDWKENEDGGVHVATMLPSAQNGLEVILLWWFPQVDRPFRRFYLVSSGSKSWSVAFTLWCELVCSIPSCLRLIEVDTNFSEQILLESFFFKRDQECDWSIVILFDLPDSSHHSCIVWGEIRFYHSQSPAINYGPVFVTLWMGSSIRILMNCLIISWVTVRVSPRTRKPLLSQWKGWSLRII